MKGKASSLSSFLLTQEDQGVDRVNEPLRQMYVHLNCIVIDFLKHSVFPLFDGKKQTGTGGDGGLCLDGYDSRNGFNGPQERRKDQHA